MSERVVIVTGSRQWPHRSVVWSELGARQPTLVVQGGAKGADTDAFTWCKRTGTPCLTVFADWEALGRAAGPERNSRMLKMYPGAEVLAFPYGESRGTRGCMRRAEELGMKVTNLGDVP